MNTALKIHPLKITWSILFSVLITTPLFSQNLSKALIEGRSLYNTITLL